MNDRTLKITAVLYLAGYLVHSVDHFARGLQLTPPALFWLGTIALPLAAAIVVLVLLGHPLAPQLAILAGTPVAIGATAVHIPPYWIVFSEPFRASVSVVDWLTLVAMVGTAVAFVAAGVAALRDRRSAARQPA